MSLAKFQDKLSALLLQELPPTAEQLSDINYFDPQANLVKKLGICHQRVRHALHQQLTAAFPTVLSIVGKQMFYQIVIDYLQDYAAQNPLDEAYLESFSDCIAEQGYADRFPYLADIAMLDLGCFKAYYADSSATLNSTHFSHFTPEVLTLRKVHLHSACFWLSSDYAIYDIWRLYNSAHPQTGINHRKAQDVIIIRPEQKVEVHEIDAGFVKVLDALDEGETLQQAFLAGTFVDRKFNTVGALQFLVQNKLIVSLY